MNKLGVHVAAGIAALLQLFAAGAALADDSEIYLGQNQTGKAYVMMTLDIRSNLFAKVGCVFWDTDASAVPDASDNYCVNAWSDEPSIYQALLEHNTEFGLGYVNDEELSVFDAMRAIFGAVFESPEFNDKYFGLMVSHNATNAGTYTSEGAYVLNGFQLFKDDDSNHAKRELLRKLYSIPEPG